MLQVVGIGAGGHAKVLIDILRHRSDVHVVALTDPAKTLWQTTVMGVPVLGDDVVLPDLLARGIGVMFVGVGGTGDNTGRRILYEKALTIGFRAIEIVHPSPPSQPT